MTERNVLVIEFVDRFQVPANAQHKHLNKNIPAPAIHAGFSHGRGVPHLVFDGVQR